MSRDLVVRVTFICACLFAPAVAAGNEASNQANAVIAAGQDEVLADMLGRGATLPGQCRFAGGQVDGATIRATYGCPGGEVVFELRHPSQSPAAATQTARFAILLRSGSPPDGLADALVSRIRSREAARDDLKWVVASPSPQHWLLVGESFFLVLIGGMLLALWRSRQSMLSRDAVLPALLTALALCLRFMAHAGPADIRSVLDENAGPGRAGWVVLLHLVHQVLPRQDEVFWTINRIVGALSVPLLYVVMRRRFDDRVAAIGGAAALAVTPLITRFSASDTPYILLCAALLGAVVAYDRYAESGSAGALALSLGLLTAAMQLRPEGAWLIVPAALLALAGRPPFPRPVPGHRGRGRRLVIAGGALLFIVLNAAPTVWALRGHPQAGAVLRGFVLVGSLVGSPWNDPDMTPRALAALVVLGALAVIYRRQWPGILWLAAVLVAQPLDFPATAQYANARYHLPAMHLACGLAGIGLSAAFEQLGGRSRRSGPFAALVAVVVLLLAASPRLDLLWRMWTPQREYEVFRDGLGRIDPTCRVVTMTNAMDSGFVPFDYLAQGSLLDIADFLAQPPPGGCVVYYRCGNCYTRDLVPAPDRSQFEINATCRAIEQRFQLEPIVETQVAALPYRGESYARDPLPLGFYRLHERAPVEAAPGAGSHPTGSGP